jgi:hypothetical protein
MITQPGLGGQVWGATWTAQGRGKEGAREEMVEQAAHDTRWMTSHRGPSERRIHPRKTTRCGMFEADPTGCDLCHVLLVPDRHHQAGPADYAKAVHADQIS